MMTDPAREAYGCGCDAAAERERIKREVQALGFRFDEGITDWIRREDVLDIIENRSKHD